MCTTLPSDVGLDHILIKSKKIDLKVSREIITQLMYQEKNKTATVLPQPVNDPSYFIPVVDVIDLFFEAENKLWNRIVNSPFPISQSFDQNSLASTSSFNLLSSFNQEANQYETNVHKLIGEAFLRHGKSSQAIHEFFIKLDPRRCCVHCREVSANIPGLLRRVSQSGVNNTKEGKKGQSSRTNYPTPRQQSVQKLSENEERIYRHALRCAFRPFLSCPIEEPSTTPQQNGNRRSFTRKPSTSSPIDNVNIEQSMLFATLARSFQISPTLHDKLREELRSKRAQDKVMEDDLTDQLYRLEANDCHFYQRQFFANSDYYEEWRSLELERLTKLINKWCPDFKHIKAYKINVFDAHSAFTILADKFLKMDLDEKIDNAAADSRTRAFTSILTAVSQKLLKEFGLRYGVGELFRKVTILEKMIKHLDYTDWYLISLNNVLMQTMEYVEENYRLLVRKERQLIEDSIKTLHKSIEYGFLKIYSLYPKNISEHGVQLLLILLQKVLQIKVYFQFWDKEENPNINEMLELYNKLAVVENYKTIKLRAELECYKDGVNYDSTQSANTLRYVLQNMKKCLQTFQDLCSKCPMLVEKCPNIINNVASNLYKEFMKDVKELCLSNTKTIQVSQIDYEMMGLAFRLHTLDKDWVRYIRPSEQKWRINYKVVLHVVIRAITEYIYEQIPNYIISDKLQVLDLSENLPSPPEPVPAMLQQPTPHKVQHSHSSAFTNVLMLRNKLRKGSAISIEGNMKAYSDPDLLRRTSIGTDIDEEVSPDILSTASSNLHPVHHVDDVLNHGESFNSDIGTDRNDSTLKQDVILENEIEERAESLVNDILIKISSPNQHLTDFLSTESIVSDLLEDVVERVACFLNQEGCESKKSSAIDRTGGSYTQVDVHFSPVVENDLANEVQFDENPHNIGVVRKRPSSQPLLWESIKEGSKISGSFASRYSMDGPITDSPRAHSYPKDYMFFTSAAPNSHKANKIGSESHVGNKTQNTSNNVENSNSSLPHQKQSSKNSNSSEHSSSSKTKANHEPSSEGAHFDPDDKLIHLPSNGLIMTTSSLTDILTACARLISFSTTVCKLILPSSNDNNNNKAPVGKELQKHYENIRKDTFSKVATSVKDVLKMYVSTLVSLDVCGSKSFKENKRFDSHLLQEVRRNRSEGIPGCRHCLTTRNEETDDEPCVILNRLIYGSLGGWELVTKEMCFRINDVHSLIKLLPCIQKKAAESLNVDINLLLQKRDANNEDDASYCTYGPSDTPVWYPSFQQLCFDLKAAEEYMNKVLHLQVKLLTFRAMDVFKKLFDALFPLPLHERTIEQHMSTCMSHLQSQMKFFRHTLYPECVSMVTLEVWKSVLEKFHVLIDELHDTKDDPRMKGRKLQSLLMIAMNRVMAGQQLHSLFYNEMRTITFRLSLFHMPLEKLCRIYGTLQSFQVHQIVREASPEPTFEELVYTINVSLKSLGRPSFPGNAFTDLLTKNEAWVDRLSMLFGFNIEFSSSVRLKLIARRFLQRNIMMRVGESRRHFRRRDQDVAMSPHPSDPKASYHAPVNVGGQTIDLIQKDERRQTGSNRSWENGFSTFGSTSSSSDQDRTPVNSVESDTEDFVSSEYVFYTFQTESGPPDVEVVGKLYAIVRAEGEWIINATKEDIIAIYKYAYRTERTNEITAFFRSNGIPRPHVRSLSCRW